MSQPNPAIFHTVEFMGFYFPPLVLWAAAALVPFVLLRWSLGRVGLYGLVWNRALFNLALYMLVLGGLVFFGNLAWL